ncbi:MAG: hypothetical protein J6V50_05840, partial [Clostridia bacterium]|nr:hypothetical protein [Clostridia bacterium]
MFIAATDLSANNSAAMCHNAYIRGMAEAGHNVSVMTVNNTAKEINCEIPNVNYHFFSDENVIVRRIRKNRANQQPSVKVHSKDGISLRKIKTLIYKIGIACLGAEKTLKRRMSRFEDKDTYDVLISLACPATSHEIAYYLTKKGKIKSKHSCQIWEDPWAMDLYGSYDEK